MKRKELLYLGTLSLLLVVVFVFNALIGTSIRSPEYLAIDLASPPDSPQDWVVQEWPLVRYRVLFHTVVDGTFSLLFSPDDAWGFYWSFVGWSFVFFLGTIFALYWLLRTLDFDPFASFVGCLLFLASPPTLLAYKYPVYTREDALAYLLVVLGLVALAKSRSFLVGLISIACALTRESSLLLPLAYLVSSTDRWLKRIFIFLLPAVALVGIRIWSGFVIGNSFESSVLNLLFPLETAAFLFCVFGVLWIPFFLGLLDRWRNRSETDRGWRAMTLSAPVVLVAVMLAALALARAREIRIEFILFPWVIAFALDWFRRNASYLRGLLRNRAHLVFSALVFAALSALVLIFHSVNSAVMDKWLADFANGFWLFLGTLHLSLTLALFLPMLRRRTAASPA